MSETINRFISDESGQGITEYGAIFGIRSHSRSTRVSNHPRCIDCSDFESIQCCSITAEQLVCCCVRCLVEILLPDQAIDLGC